MEAPRRRDATVYGELAATMAPRYALTAAAVHLWVHRGLLPPAYLVRDPDGQITAACRAQLEALCRHRFDEAVTRLDWVGFLLWLDGFEIPLRLVRRVLTAEAHRVEPGRLRAIASEAQTDRVARSVTRMAEPRLDAVELADIADVTLTVIESLGGEATPSEAVLELLAQRTGGESEDARTMFDTIAEIAGHGLTAITTVGKAEYESARELWRANDYGDLVGRGRSAKPRIRMHRLLAAFLGVMLLDQVQRSGPTR